MKKISITKEGSLKYAVAGTAVLSALLMSGTAFAATNDTTTPGAMHGHWGGMMGGRGMHPGVFGTVTAVSGNIVTITSKQGGPNSTATPTTYTVDASSATITKNSGTPGTAPTTITVSGIAVGDTIMADGTVTGTNVVAKTIRDGVMMGRGGQGFGKGMGGGNGPGGTAPASIITGNGQPVIGGSVTAISGSTLTITNKSNVTYSVDATNAVVEKGNATSSVANIAVGDNVVVQGTVNGTSVVASSVIDSGATPAAPTAGTTPQPRRGGIGGFLGGIGSFFHNLFGF